MFKLKLTYSIYAQEAFYTKGAHKCPASGYLEEHLRYVRKQMIHKEAKTMQTMEEGKQVLKEFIYYLLLFLFVFLPMLLLMPLSIHPQMVLVLQTCKVSTLQLCSELSIKLEWYSSG